MSLGEDGARQNGAGPKPFDPSGEPIEKMGAARAFELVRREAFAEFGADFHTAYVEPLRLVAEWNGELVFRACSAVAQERLNQHKPRIEARLRAYLPDLKGVKILLERELPEDVRALANAPRLAVGAAGGGSGSSGSTPTNVPIAPREHPHSFTFDAFCVDQSNFRAFTVAQMIATGAGMAFPVVLIHSPPGAGKTHLLNAIRHEAALRTPDRSVLLMSGQEFLEGFQSALHRKRDSHAFKDVVRAPDLLLIDDFQRICGKRATEQEVFHTIASLTARGRQVVLTANHSAQGLEGLDDQLREKLKGATACEIMDANQELRRRILDMRARHYARVTPGFAVAPAALDMIAERMHVSGRELDGAVSQLVIESQISGGMEVSVEAAASALQGRLAEAGERRITVAIVQKVVARYYNMSVPQLLERTRRANIAKPRQICMYLATKMTHASLPHIGQRFGGFDHTTIMYARNRVAEMVEIDPKVRTEVETLMRLIRREPSSGAPASG